MITCTRASAESLTADWLVVVITQNDQLPSDLVDLDRHLGGKLKGIWDREDFSGKYGETLALRQTAEIAAVNLMLTGGGQPEQLTKERLRRTLLSGLRRIAEQKHQTVAVTFAGDVSEELPDTDLAELAADCILVAPIDASVYQQKPSRTPFRSAQVVTTAQRENTDDAVRHGRILAEADILIRDLVNRTANEIHPRAFADRAVAMAEECGLSTRVLDGRELEHERMRAMLAVARGSEFPARLVCLSWPGAPDSTDVIGLAGKGVTFDSGGLSIKPAESMIAMKADMAGAATMLGVIIAAARMELPINVRAYLGLVENMISGGSVRPGDVIVARNGTSVEIQNTDAEGRLVLADLLSFAVDNGVTHLIDAATLTGACVVALGEELTGVFAGDQTLSRRVLDAADHTGEGAWPMPMHEHFDELLKSDVADCRNIGPRWGGAVTAARFLKKFVGEIPWVHLDIAGPSWADSSAGWRDSGATGAMLRTLVQMLRSWN